MQLNKNQDINFNIRCKFYLIDKMSEKLTLSRNCEVEQVSKCHWETGKTKSVLKLSQENCLIFYVHFAIDKKVLSKCRISAPFCESKRRFCFFIAARETRTARQHIK